MGGTAKAFAFVCGMHNIVIMPEGARGGDGIGGASGQNWSLEHSVFADRLKVHEWGGGSFYDTTAQVTAAPDAPDAAPWHCNCGPVTTFDFVRPAILPVREELVPHAGIPAVRPGPVRACGCVCVRCAGSGTHGALGGACMPSDVLRARVLRGLPRSWRRRRRSSRSTGSASCAHGSASATRSPTTPKARRSTVPRRHSHLLLADLSAPRPSVCSISPREPSRCLAQPLAARGGRGQAGARGCEECAQRPLRHDHACLRLVFRPAFYPRRRSAARYRLYPLAGGE